MSEGDRVAVPVNLADRSYAIHIGAGLLSASASLLAPLRGSQVAIFSNAQIFELYGAKLKLALSDAQTDKQAGTNTDTQVDVFLMPDGEEHKSLSTYADAMEFLMQHRHNRTTSIIALGGGVVGDLAGFVAATFQRGVDFYQIPTTLLAQVDSSVGGKTAVNHALGKNMIGAFYQPRTVVIDTDVLVSLPEREYAAGLAEVVKYGMIYDAGFFAELEAHVPRLKVRDQGVLRDVIKRCCEIKAEVVAEDEREAGLRAILNFGHTFGHAVENLSGYGTYLHGEAVAIGMCMATSMCVKMGWLEAQVLSRLETLLQNLALPVRLSSALGGDAMLNAMGMDKKTEDGRLRFVLLQAIGQCAVTSDYDQQALRQTLEEYNA